MYRLSLRIKCLYIWQTFTFHQQTIIIVLDSRTMLTDLNAVSMRLTADGRYGKIRGFVYAGPQVAWYIGWWLPGPLYGHRYKEKRNVTLLTLSRNVGMTISPEPTHRATERGTCWKMGVTLFSGGFKVIFLWDQKRVRFRVNVSVQVFFVRWFSCCNAWVW